MPFEPVWQTVRQRRRLPIIAASVACVIGFLLVLKSGLPVDISTLKVPHSTSNTSLGPAVVIPTEKLAQDLWRTLQPLLDEHAPAVPPPVIAHDAKSDRYDANKKPELMDKTEMRPGDILQMADAHKSFLLDIKEQLPKFQSVKGAARRGIVTVAGDFYFPVFMVSLHLLRRTGCTLPVEVFLANEHEYETGLCEQILPSLNAKCRILSKIVNPDNSTTHEIKTYQYKIFSIIFSSFDEVLFLDADNFPLHNPEELLIQEPYKSTGMVTWPDFWAPTISPVYYLLSGQSPSSTSNHSSTESGQILVNKRTHFQTLLLVAYYNYYGPTHYYPLLCQGGAGRGDKGTFLPAAIVMGVPFYATSEPVLAVGHEENGHLYTYAMIQHDPVEDYKLTSKGLWRVKDKTVAKSPRPMFLHTNTPKWNPKNIFDHPGEYDLTHKMNGEEVPAYLDPKENVAVIQGVERWIWDAVKWVGCDLEHAFKEWKDEHEICNKIHRHFAEVLDHR